MYRCIDVYMYICIHVYMYYMYICIYVYMYICTHTHTQTYLILDSVHTRTHAANAETWLPASYDVQIVVQIWPLHPSVDGQNPALPIIKNIP